MNDESTASLNYGWARCIIEELYRHSITHFCLSPGSRCTPLTAAVALHTELQATVHFDERGAAFFALGLARALNQPTALLSTSGTAVANYLPAIVEAAMDCIPLIVLTADRPPELRDAGVNQTIDQVKIFGDYVRWQVDVPCPTPEILPEMILTTVDQAVYRATRSPAGPVHLNCMFREPFLPDNLDEPHPHTDSPSSSILPERPRTYWNGISKWSQSGQPHTQYANSRVTIPPGAVDQISALVAKESSGLLVVGRLPSEEDRLAVLNLMHKLRWPVYADITSGLRLGYPKANIIHYFDLLLYHHESVETFAPDVILQFGRSITSKRLYKHIRSMSLDNFYMIDNNPNRMNPEHISGYQFEADIPLVCEALINRLGEVKKPSSLATLEKQSKRLDILLDDTLDGSKRLSEPAVARLISRLVPKNSGLFIASSMPIRNMDLFATGAGNQVHMGTNRGASGIDGTVASAAGFAKGLGQVTTLLIGDLALLHDLNSLALITSEQLPVVIVVINNNGGGIFSFLPIATHEAFFEKYFGTPHNFTFEKAAEMFRLSYKSPIDQKSFVNSYKTAVTSRAPTLIEVVTDRQESVDLHRKIIEQITSSKPLL